MSTLALDGSSGAVGSTRMATALRYLDLVLLALALPVFIAADLPIAGYVVVACVWLIQHAIELAADRAAARAVERGDRRAAMGWIGATTLARVTCSPPRTSMPRGRSSSPGMQRPLPEPETYLPRAS